jgi:hypothetical protein
LPSFGDEEIPDQFYDLECLKHTDVHIVSPIDVHKWNKAKWRGAFFMTVPNANDAIIRVMTPSSSENLDRFLAEYNRHGRYLLVSAHLPSIDGVPRPMMHTVLGKYHLTVREAWEIGINDPNIIALDLDDPSIIPPNHPSVPVLKAIERLRAMQHQRPQR